MTSYVSMAGIGAVAKIFEGPRREYVGKRHR